MIPNIALLTLIATAALIAWVALRPAGSHASICPDPDAYDRPLASMRAIGLLPSTDGEAIMLDATLFSNMTSNYSRRAVLEAWGCAGGHRTVIAVSQ